MYSTIRIATRLQRSRYWLSPTAVCGHCQKRITAGQSYVVHAVETAQMQAPAFLYYHLGHSPNIGSGWGAFRRGEALTDLSLLMVGQLMLEYRSCPERYRVLRITRRESNPQDQTFRLYGLEVNPERPEQRHRDSKGELILWDPAMCREPIGDCLYFKPLIQPEHLGQNPRAASQLCIVERRSDV